VSRNDIWQETKRGIGILCRCGRPARITARAQTLCYECFDAQMGILLEPLGAHQGPTERAFKRIRELDHMANTRDAVVRP
jgi:hypothetical protein